MVACFGASPTQPRLSPGQVLAGEQIEDHSPVEPAFAGRDAGDIRSGSLAATGGEGLLSSGHTRERCDACARMACRRMIRATRLRLTQRPAARRLAFPCSSTKAKLPVAPGQNPQALATMLYRATNRLCRAGPPLENLAHSASFHPPDNNAPANPRTKHLK